MSELTEAEITHLSHLSRLSLSEEERLTFKGQLPKIVEFVDMLGQVRSTESDGGGKVGDLTALRDDTVNSERLSIEEVSRLAPDFAEDKVVVPPVLGESTDV